MRAALRVFGDAGYARARLRDVARDAGVSKATLYLYFDSKEALFGEMVRRYAGAALEPESVVAGFFPDTPQKKLERFLRDSWAALRTPELARITRLVHAEQAGFPELARLYFDEVVLRLRARLERVLTAGIARGEFRAVSHDFALHAVPSLLVHQAMLREGFAEADPAALSDQQLLQGARDLILDGVLRRGSRHAAE